MKGNGNVSSCQIETNMAKIERSLQFMSIKTLGLTHHKTWGKKILSQKPKKMIKPFFLVIKLSHECKGPQSPSLFQIILYNTSFLNFKIIRPKHANWNSKLNALHIWSNCIEHFIILSSSKSVWNGSHVKCFHPKLKWIMVNNV